MLGSEKGKPNYGEISPWPSGRNFYFREPNTRGVEFVAHANVLGAGFAESSAMY